MSVNVEELVQRLDSIEKTLEDIKSAIDDVNRNMPDSSDNYGVESRLDTVISLLKKVLNNM